jgi:hypothetical protein
MQKYVIAIGSEEISRKVQAALFSAGFTWESCGQQIDNVKDRFLFVHYFDDNVIIRDSNSLDATKDIRKGCVLISSQEVIADPFQLDGAKSPVKEMTVAEISTKLGYEVKITK